MSDERQATAAPDAESRQILLESLARGACAERAAGALARLLVLPLRDARLLLTRYPSALPRALEANEAERWRMMLNHAGLSAVVSSPARLDRCHAHVKHWSSTDCPGCGQSMCALCSARSPRTLLCARCCSHMARKKRFYRLRVAILLAVLALVSAYAALDHARRDARRAWERPLQIALIFVSRAGVDPDLVERLEQRVPALEAALAKEFSRYGGEFTPVRFRRFGPVAQTLDAPIARAEPSILEPFWLSLALWRFAREHDRASGLDDDHYDGKIYVLLSPPARQRLALVEGLGQEGGRLAVTHLELSADSIDFGLFVVAHELCHLLGATDRYGPDGRTLIPEGLAEPTLEPLYPQRAAEVMARGRVLSQEREVPLDELDELRVGPRTAAEIGWVRADDER